MDAHKIHKEEEVNELTSKRVDELTSYLICESFGSSTRLLKHSSTRQLVYYSTPFPRP